MEELPIDLENKPLELTRDISRPRSRSLDTGTNALVLTMPALTVNDTPLFSVAEDEIPENTSEDESLSPTQKDPESDASRRTSSLSLSQNSSEEDGHSTSLAYSVGIPSLHVFSRTLPYFKLFPSKAFYPEKILTRSLSCSQLDEKDPQGDENKRRRSCSSCSPDLRRKFKEKGVKQETKETDSKETSNTDEIVVQDRLKTLCMDVCNRSYNIVNENINRIVPGTIQPENTFHNDQNVEQNLYLEKNKLITSTESHSNLNETLSDKIQNEPNTLQKKAHTQQIKETTPRNNINPVNKPKVTEKVKMFSRFRKSNKIDSENKNPPWENPDAQPPPLPKCYSSFSPPSVRKQVKPASISGPAIEPTSKPTHFNRPSPVTSPPISQRGNQIQDSGIQHFDKEQVVEVAPWRSPPSKRKTDRESSPQVVSQIISDQNQRMTENTQIHNLTMMSNQTPPRIISEEQPSAKLNDIQMAPDMNKTVPLHLVEKNGLQSNFESIATVTYSSFGQSYSETSEKSLVSKEFSSEMVSVQSESSGIDLKGPKEAVCPQIPPQKPSPPPWRKAHTTEMPAKDDASAAKVPWRKERDVGSMNVELKGAPPTDTVPRQFVESRQNYPQVPQKPLQQKTQQFSAHQHQQLYHQQQQQQQQQQHIQQRQPQQPTNQQDVPWRSPHLKRKVLSNTQSPAFNNIKQHTPSVVSHASAEQISQESLQKSAQQSSEQVSVTVLKQETPAPVPTQTTTDAKQVTMNKSEPCVASAVPLPQEQNKDKEEIDQKEKQMSPPPCEKAESTVTIQALQESENKALKEVSSTETKEESVECVKVESYSRVMKTSEQSETTSSASSSFSPPPPPIIHKGEESLAPSAEDSALPPPPANLLKMDELPQDIPIQPPESLAFRITGLGAKPEEDVTSPEYTQEPVTSRIQKFEKQATFEAEKKKEESYPAVKPVAPWVKKTSAGPVQLEGWDLSPIEGVSQPNIASLPNYETKQVHDSSKVETEKFAHPKSSIPQTLDRESKLYGRQDTVMLKPAGDAPGINVKPDMTVPHKEKEYPLALKHKQLALVQEKSRPRSRSIGDYSHTYTETDVLRMPARAIDATTVPTLAKQTPEKPDDVFDAFCDPDHPKIIQFQDISAAAFKIKSGIMNTPCTHSNISKLLGTEVFFKKEFNQYTGSFKERGARYTLLCLSNEQKEKGVIAASAGNHALALCYHGQDLEIPVTVVMPLVAPIMKVQACRQYGANILVKGADIGECREIALKMAKEKELVYINGYDHPDILAGQGTMGLEIVEQVKNIDAVVVPVGGGGLIAGLALAVKSLYPSIKVIGVESERCASFGGAMKANKPVYVKAEPTLADGLAVPKVGVNAFALGSKLIDKMVTVKEEWIAIAILRLVEMEKAVVEGAGAAAFAALLAGELPELKGKRVVIPLCGGNIDTTILGRCLDRGLAADGRLIKFTVTVSDRPGGIADLTRLLANLGVSIKDMLHERAWIKSDIFSVAVRVVCETRDFEQMLELKGALESRYKYIDFPLPDLALTSEDDGIYNQF